ncbi:zinc finger protein 883-like [Eupeodes corollae]|uniref:zinc finger protein 883-like n=1 Tax=Eupeodes corollae TaxID=290404 RepID=UPI0024920EC1|nr:zinc finger protein 883-like [Eupeodes corollae]
MTLDICRICGTTEDLKHIFNEGNDELVEQIRLCANIQIDVNDCLPKYVCNECETGLAFSYRLRQRSEQTEKRLREDLLITNVEPLSLGEESTIIDTSGHNSLEELCEEVGTWSRDEDIANFDDHENLIDEEEEEGLPEIQSDEVSEEPWIEEENTHESEKILENSVMEQVEDDLVEFIEISIARNDLDTQDTVDSPTSEPETKQFECEICYELFEEKSKYTSHLRKHDDKHFNCNVCDKVFTQRYRYEEHMKNHFTLDKAFPCSICQKSYTNQSNMERHVRSVHNQERNFQCAQCGASFGRSDILKMHMAKHSDKRTIECGVCHKAFKTSQSLHYHMRIHLNHQGRQKKPPRIRAKRKANAQTFRCDHCDKVSHHRTTHINHMRIHTGEKPFKCSTCNKAFRTTHARSNHELLHTDKRPHACKECGMAFRQTSHLKSHMLTHSGDKNHVCEVCQKAFAMRSNLVAHLRIHTGEMAYACNQCPKKFLLSSQFKRHKLTHGSSVDDGGDVLRMESCQENESEFHDPQTGFCMYEIIERAPDNDGIVVE